MPTRPPPTPKAIGEITHARIPVNAANEVLAAAAFTNAAFELARAAGLARSEPLSEELFKGLVNSGPRALFRFLSVLELAPEAIDPNAPVAGFWVLASMARSPLFPNPERLRLEALSVERAPEPHRDPLAYGGREDSSRPPQSIRQETLAYWEARDLRSALPLPAHRSARPAL